MANKIINNSIEFAYASENPIIELKKELEKHFLYQTILIVDAKYEYSCQIEKMKNNIKCNFKVCRDIEKIDNLEQVGCVININSFNINKIKNIVYKNNIPYVVILNKIVDASIFKSENIYNNKIIQCNFPLGIIFDKSQIFNKKEFVCKFLAEISNVTFENNQEKLNNLFYNVKIDYELLDGLNKHYNKSKTILVNQCKDLDNLIDEIADLYVLLCIKKSKSNFSILDKLLYLFLQQNSAEYKNEVEIKHIFKIILSSLEYNYFKYFNINLKGTINYEVHKLKLEHYGIKTNFNQRLLPENKINFLLNEFKEKFVVRAKSEQDEIFDIKNLLADIDINYVYNLFNMYQTSQFIEIINIVSNVFSLDSILGLMYQCGLLNYNI